MDCDYIGLLYTFLFSLIEHLFFFGLVPSRIHSLTRAGSRATLRTKPHSLYSTIPRTHHNPSFEQYRIITPSVGYISTNALVAGPIIEHFLANMIRTKWTMSALWLVSRIVSMFKSR